MNITYRLYFAKYIELTVCRTSEIWKMIMLVKIFLPNSWQNLLNTGQQHCDITCVIEQ